MAKGDVYNDLQSINNNSYLSIQPNVGAEVTIHNLLYPYGSTVELYFTDGTNEILIDSDNISGRGFFLHCTNSKYYKLKNISGSTIYIGYDGIQIK